jgi:hypothetical protein
VDGVGGVTVAALTTSLRVLEVEPAAAASPL